MSGTSYNLCLACSSSLSPKAQQVTTFLTPCCSRPICERCLAKNPRLRGYNPCLVCLAGVAVVEHSWKTKGKQVVQIPGASGRSVAEEESTYVIGDSDEDNDVGSSHVASDAPPPYSSYQKSSLSEQGREVATDHSLLQASGKFAAPSLYYIQPGDTLRGVALKFGISGAKICQMNALPLSTLSTTPHLLHTRHILSLPSGKRIPASPDLKVIEGRKREQATKRFQLVTKEVNWDIAKTYLALAEAGLDEGQTSNKEDVKVHFHIPRQGSGKGSYALDEAVGQYLEDMEWEAQQRDGHIPEFPLSRARDKLEPVTHDKPHT